MAKIDRKKLLKEPDEFQTFWDKAVRWGQANTKVIFTASLAIVALLGGYLGIMAYLDHREAAASEALAPVSAQYLEYLGAGNQPKPEDVQKAKDLAGRLAELCGQYGATEAGMQARLVLGDLRFSLGEYDLAADEFRGLSEEPGLPPQLAPLAWHGLGQSQEAKGNPADAAVSYARSVDLAGPNLGAAFRLDQARALAAAGQKDQAIGLYKTLAQNADPTLANQAKNALAALGVEG